MFKLTQSPTYWFPVELFQLGADGAVERVEIDVLFARLSVDEEEALLAEVHAHKLLDRSVAPRLMRGWRKVADEAGAELPWSEPNRDAFLNIAGNATQVMRAYFTSRNQAALGNLHSSRADGPPLNGASPNGALTPTAPIRH